MNKQKYSEIQSKDYPYKNKGIHVLVNIGLFLASLLLCFTIAEIFFAYWEMKLLKSMGVFIPVDPRYDGSAWEVDPMQANRFTWQSDGNSIVHIRSKNKKLMYELRPNSVISGMIKINSDGFRDREFSREKPHHVFRIAVVGDSVTFGWRQRLEDTYPKKLEQLLQANNKTNTQIEVLNFGIGGYNAEQEVELIKTKVLNYNPDLILIGFCPNDGQIGFDGGLWWHFFRGPSRTISFLKLLYLYNKYKHDDLALLKNPYSELAELSRQKNIPVCVCIFPMLQGDKLWCPPRFIPLLDELKIPYINLIPEFEKKNVPELLLDVVHFTVAGHYFVAEQIYHYLTENKIISLQ
ncbi:MAG: SGNH/GDSL hydrolase family protein [Candidatus Hydrogenedens sp.]